MIPFNSYLSNECLALEACPAQMQPLLVDLSLTARKLRKEMSGLRLDGNRYINTFLLVMRKKINITAIILKKNKSTLTQVNENKF